MIIDSDGVQIESDESNNANQDLEIDNRRVQLYDALPPVTEIVGFSSENRARLYLLTGSILCRTCEAFQPEVGGQMHFHCPSESSADSTACPGAGLHTGKMHSSSHQAQV